MYSKIKNILILSLVILFSSSMSALAHSGRTDSSGGHNCNVGSCAGTYHYHNGGSAYQPTKNTYVAPICNKPNLSDTKGSLEFKEVDCKQDVTFTWDKGIGDNEYSVALSKTAGADPGPVADTTTRSVTFNDVAPGKWYVNVKGGNSCGWSGVYNWEVDVPEPEIAINRFNSYKLDDGTTELKFVAKCGASYSITPEVGNLTQTQIKEGRVIVNPEKETTYTLTVSVPGQTKKRTHTVLAPTPAPDPSPTSSPTVQEVTVEAEVEDSFNEDVADLNSEAQSSSFWDELLNNKMLTTILRVMIFRF
ncbi:MAG: YHYH domain-containing protein [Candidatus Pacebacteria bacterium]|nr:YHYH domain-containing protein [Candidatus Paceibacterota bacterium]PIR63323.1 MAG: hypothetical protein COU64_05060 [Candidatus Pacebacteria bacterium CG10_big_fil_rev_8_21_14_0_10_40_26]PIZ79031.1 MAG: hypothetical protein COY01_01230 [Candidatus Pacebacteria bacterium CG_4_10_14_0_2_um_filter_40_20]PJA68523.1 MAG: hypothetical protein CO156_04790 [Candidatus Pacebacteria bacterium CG_4_9_14_3_um_filter_40_12]PJC41907.1 MAG: hypothetical protein CO041_02040 [Candidatus Pacebacteria bacteri